MFVVLCAVIVVSIQLVLAHGSMANPISRVFACYLEGPETPDSVACSDVIESSGTQPLYDWNEINQGNAGGNHQALIPDGQLCSAGREKYAAFDEGRTDWARTIMPDSGAYTFLYDAYVPHNNGYFELWVTKDGYDPTVPLKWADIEQFAVIQRPPVVGDNYEMTVDLPAGKSGHHVIYSIWQRYDSQEAFYACSDVWFGAAPTPVPTAAPACLDPAWNSATSYEAGELVSHNGATWRANWGSVGIEPSGTAAPWRIRSYCSSDGSVTPIPPTDVPPTATDTPGEPTNTPVPPTATTPPTSGSCSVDYAIANQWGTGFQADVTITNNETTAVSGWNLDWAHADSQVVTSGWNVTIAQTGNSVSASNPASNWNGNIGANGGTVSFGFQANSSGAAVIPTDFVLNGTACGDVVVTPPAPTATSVPPTATSVPPTDVAPTATDIAPTTTSVPPTVTTVPPTATSVPPTATSVPPTATTEPAGGCQVAYALNDWGSGFTAGITVTNNGNSAIDGWTLDWAYDGNQTITNVWNATVTQSGKNVTATDSGWNGTLAPNGSASFGFQGSYSGSNTAPTTFSVNGEVCN